MARIKEFEQRRPQCVDFDEVIYGAGREVSYIRAHIVSTNPARYPGKPVRIVYDQYGRCSFARSGNRVEELDIQLP